MAPSMRLSAAVAAGLLLAALPPACAKYVLHVVADDLGYDDVGWRNGHAITPTLNTLVQNGVEIPEFYTYMMCAPARGSTLSGRYPSHLGVYTKNFAEWDLEKAKLLPAALKAGNGARTWVAHALGKWHLGWYFRNYTATYRGFDTFFGSSGNYGGGEGYWQHTLAGAGRCGSGPHTFASDFIDASGTDLRLADPSVFGEYDTNVLSLRAMQIVNEHPLAQNLYVYLAYHNVHDPQNAPCRTVERYTHTRWDGRKVSNAMLTELDSGVGNVTGVMRAKGMWNETLIIFHTDNGGPSDHASNHPLRGAKFGFWEGGLRGVAFVSGGGLPSSVHGSKFEGLAHVSDWYATIAGYAGVELPRDTGTAPLDSISLWDSISRGTASPRTEVLHMPVHPDIVNGECIGGAGNSSTPAAYKGCSPALRVGQYKLIIGWPGFDKICTDTPPTPTSVPFGNSGGGRSNNNTHCTGGEWNPQWENGTASCVPHCLFDVHADPGERHDLSADPVYAPTVAKLQHRLAAYSASGADFPSIQTTTRYGKTLDPLICANYNATGFWLPVDWFNPDSL